MGMFGNLLGKSQQPQPDQPGMGMGDMGIIQAPDQPQRQQDYNLRTFENTPGWKVMLGGLFDGLAQMGGMKPTFIPQLQQNRQRQWEMSKMAQQQGLEYQRQMALKQYERDNPSPTAVMQNYQFMQGLGKPDLAEGYLANLGDPAVTLTLPGDRVYSGPRSGLGAAMTASPNANGGVPTAPSGAQFGQRPAGMSDSQLINAAHDAVRQGANVETVFRRLQAWGVNP